MRKPGKQIDSQSLPGPVARSGELSTQIWADLQAFANLPVGY